MPVKNDTSKASKYTFWSLNGGEPIEFFFTPGSASDVAYLEDFDFDLPAEATVYADAIHHHNLIEDGLAEDGQIILFPFHKKNSKRPVPLWQRLITASAASLPSV